MTLDNLVTGVKRAAAGLAIIAQSVAPSCSPAVQNAEPTGNGAPASRASVGVNVTKASYVGRYLVMGDQAMNRLVELAKLLRGDKPRIVKPGETYADPVNGGEVTADSYVTLLPTGEFDRERGSDNYRRLLQAAALAHGGDFVVTPQEAFDAYLTKAREYYPAQTGQ